MRGRNQDNQAYTAREKPIAPDLPLVILTDQYSASASEIVAAWAEKKSPSWCAVLSRI